MKLTTKGRYAVMAMADLALNKSLGPISLKDISVRQNISLPYLEQMDKAYSHASVVCSRAGASTISELIAFQKPALLVPYPYAKDDHQTLNADVMASHNLAKKIANFKILIKK